MALFDTPAAGLLSPDIEAKIKQQQLMSLGLGLLQGSGPSATPVSLGQLIGQAGMGAMSQGESLRDRAIQQALMGRKIAQEDSEAQRIKRAREAAAATVPETLRTAFVDDPATASAAAGLMPKQKDPTFVKDLKLPDGTTVSGYISPEGFVPATAPVAPEPTENENKQVLALRTAHDTLKDLKSTFAKTGTEILPTAGKTRLGSQYRNLQLQLKELFNLGVLNGPDLELMNQVLVDPTSVSANALYGGTDRVLASMEEVQKFIENKEKALLQSPGVKAREGNSIIDRSQGQNTVNWSDL
jgi:hypothetical protein